MDARSDTLSSGRFGGQWAFLSQQGPAPQTRSVPPTSSYIRNDRSSVSPLPTGLHFHHFNTSRSSLPRNIYNPSVGGYSSTTHPSQPVLIRVHSDVASAHLRLPPRPPRRRSFGSSKLPPISEYSFEGIWNTVEADVEEDVNAIAEIWGQHRLVLADQHESHLPQGEIRATPPSLQAVAEAGSSAEHLAANVEDVNVMIADPDASLVEGSNSGSTAYGVCSRRTPREGVNPSFNGVNYPRGRSRSAWLGLGVIHEMWCCLDHRKLGKRMQQNVAEGPRQRPKPRALTILQAVSCCIDKQYSET
jgi:hypothetical protein